MARRDDLHRRGAVYYLLVHVPGDLQPAMDGKKQIWRSLGTTDYAEAKRRKSALKDQWTATFDEMRRKRDLTDHDIGVAVWQHYSTKLDEGEKIRRDRPTPDQIERATEKAYADARASGAFDDGFAATVNAMTDVEILIGKADWDARRRATRLNRLQVDLASGDTRLIEIEADQFLSKHGFKIERHGERYRDLCFKLMRADIEQLKRLAERDQGDFTGKIADPIVVEAHFEEVETPKPRESIMDVFGRFERENPRGIRPETMTQTRRDVQHFADFVGSTVRPSKITKRLVSDWKDALAEWPVKATETAAFKGLSVRDTIEANKKLDKPKPTLTRNTIRRYMSSLGAFSRWLADNGWLEHNPVSGMLPDKMGPANPRDSFADDALLKLFGSPLFRTCASDDWRDAHKPGNFAVRDHRFWIPIVMLYSGARPGEIAQLQTGDVRQHHGVWIMHITDEGDGEKRTKTESSKRVVPVHPELIRVGFLDHCQKMAEAGQAQIFPELVIPKVGQIAAEFSRAFNRYLTKIGVKTNKAIVTYSLRHTFTDRARKAGFMDAEIALIVGHDKATQTGKYGNEKEGTVQQRRAIVEAVSYPKLFP